MGLTEEPTLTNHEMKGRWLYPGWHSDWPSRGSHGALCYFLVLQSVGKAHYKVCPCSFLPVGKGSFQLAAVDKDHHIRVS